MLLTWCAGEPFNWHPRRVLRPSPHRHPAYVPWRSGLTRLHHRPDGNKGEAGLAWLLGAGRLPWCIDHDRVCVWLRWLAWIERLSGAGRRRWDDERDVDLLDSGSGRSGIWRRSRPLWSQGHSLDRERKRHTPIYGLLSKYMIGVASGHNRSYNSIESYGKCPNCNRMSLQFALFCTSSLRFRPHTSILL